MSLNLFKNKVIELNDILINDYETLTEEQLQDILILFEQLDSFDVNQDVKYYISNVTINSCLSFNGCNNNSCLSCYIQLQKNIDELYNILDELVICYNCHYIEFESNCEFVRNEYYCPDCDAPSQELSDYHSYKVINNTNSLRTIGLELETEFPYGVDTEQVCYDIETNFIPSYDGSLSNGIEFVSNVYDISNKKVLYKDIEETIDQLLYYNCKCHKSINSGLHIHISKSALNVPIQKLFDFVYNNKVFFMSISGRIPDVESFRYCKPNNNYCNDEEVTTRYGLLNINSKYNTIEFRLFNSTLNIGTIIKRIEFLLLLIEFLNSEKPLYLIDFLNFIKHKDTELFNWVFYWFDKRASDIRGLLSEL